MTGNVIAKVTNVSHRYGATVALDDVSIDIPSRIMVGVIGPDGVGKSSLLALIAGVRKIQQGEVVVFDKDVSDRGNLREIRGRIAYMPQGLGRNIYPTLSVFENIDFFGRLFGQGAEERRTRITELLTATAMEKFEARPAGKLSGGSRHRRRRQSSFELSAPPHQPRPPQPSAASDPNACKSAVLDPKRRGSREAVTGRSQDESQLFPTSAIPTSAG